MWTWSRVAAAVLILVGVLRMASTFRVFSATTDEPSHIGCGLEVLELHRYTMQPENPPLARVIMAAIPYWSGMHVGDKGGFYERVDPVFNNQNKYEHNLVAGRASGLLFFGIAAVVFWMWACRELGDQEALVGLLLFSMQPIVLGYMTLATHDGPGVAGMALSLLAFSAWLQRPSLSRALLLGAAWGVAISLKFSCIPFVPAACIAIFLVRIATTPDQRRTLIRAVPASALVIIPTAALVVWGGYGFTMGRIGDLASARTFAGPMGALANLNARWPLPAPAFFRGIADLLQFDRVGMDSYFYGHWSRRGWWWYFPAALLLKTTLPFLALLLAGAFALRGDKRRRRAFLEGTAASMAMFAVASRSTLDIGVRYVLPIYLPLTLAATAAVFALLGSRRAWVRYATAGLVAAHMLVSFAAHPDYFPYFNAIAGKDPSRYLVDSNLDWGQDALRLRHALRVRNVQSASVMIGGPIDYVRLGFPPIETAMDPNMPGHGWVAVSDHLYRSFLPRGWWWLKRQPYARVGKSIRLYYID